MSDSPDYTALLGAPASDSVSGFSGIATAFCRYFLGHPRIEITPRVAEDGAAREPQWFDVSRVDFGGAAQAETPPAAPIPLRGAA